jgi:hypothetical protein
VITFMMEDSVRRYNSERTLWDEDFREGLGALSFSVKGDTASNVLWRLNNGELPPEFKPPVFYIQVGLNDLGVEMLSAIEVR